MLDWITERFLEIFNSVPILLGADPQNSELVRVVAALLVLVVAIFTVSVWESRDRVVGTLQLTMIPGLSRHGMLRAQIEGVRVADGQRGRGLGRRMIEHAIDLAREQGCGLVQLTSDKRRPDAVRFYQSLGFTASHEGLKLSLD